MLLVRLFLVLFTMTPILEAREIRKSIGVSDIDSVEYYKLLETYGSKKSLPVGFERQALIALSYYPELKDIKIEFRFTNSGPPMQARPTIWSTLTRSAPKRTYLVNIATSTMTFFEPILLQNMPFDAQVGVLGHELAHIVNFSKKSFWGIMGVLFGNLSPRYLDRMEYETDDLAIVHGLGHQLLAWSVHVSQSFDAYVQSGNTFPKIIQNAMTNERYMTPSTIRHRMTELNIYEGTAP